MIAVIQRVDQAEVSVDGTIYGSIQKGSLVYLGVEQGDTEEDMQYLVKKIKDMRIFHDDQGRMNRSIIDIGGKILLISQFTLCADTSKGNRPYFGNAAPPDIAEKLYLAMQSSLNSQGVPTECGVFGAYMKVSYINDGPVTITLSSRKPK